MRLRQIRYIGVALSLLLAVVSYGGSDFCEGLDPKAAALVGLLNQAARKTGAPLGGKQEDRDLNCSTFFRQVMEELHSLGVNVPPEFTDPGTENDPNNARKLTGALSTHKDLWEQFSIDKVQDLANRGILVAGAASAPAGEHYHLAIAQPIPSGIKQGSGRGNEGPFVRDGNEHPPNDYDPGWANSDYGAVRSSRVFNSKYPLTWYAFKPTITLWDRLAFKYGQQLQKLCQDLATRAHSWRSNIWGDTHIITPDGQGYDFQAVGEFIALKSTADSFEVQVRQAPYGSSRTISVMTAVAINVSGDHVGIYLGVKPQLHINGTPTTLMNATKRLPHGGLIQQSQNQYVIELPDFTALRVDLNGTYLNVSTDLSDARHTKLVGLLGTFDTVPGNDMTTRQGRSIGALAIDSQSSYESLYRIFGDSWRISQAESLFDYGVGKNTRTYTDLTFPDRNIALSSLNSSAIQAADAKCRAAGLTQEPYLKACILDVAVTGDAGFANASVQPHADHTVHDMVEKIRAGEHAAMPSAERSSIPIQGLTGQAIITIKNSTGYELSIFFDGPVSRKVTLAPGATQDVGLIPGMFHVAGRVAAAKILPFYGEETYQGSKYTVTFYISR